MTYKPKHPCQPVELKPNGVAYFKENAIVRAFLEAAREGRTLNLNDTLGDGKFSEEDQVQFAQLIGYSVSGWKDLTFVKSKDRLRADNQVKKMERNS